MGRVESKKRGKGGREKETGGGTEKISRGGETTKRGSKEADKCRGGVVEAKRGRQYLLSESGLTGSSCTGVVKELVEEDKSISISSV